MNTLDEYSEQDFKAAFKETVAKLLYDCSLRKSEHPAGVLLGGQSGAGKSTLHRIYKQKFGGNVVVINGDEYRKSHPHFEAIQERYGVDAPAHTAKWSGAMTEALIDALSEQGFNLVIEGILRTSSVPLGTAELLRSRGYDISLAVMAVKPKISLISCQIRYEMMRIAGTTPRATDPEHHRQIVTEIVDNLTVLEDSGIFSGVELYDRLGACRYPSEDASATAAETLREILLGEWTDEERGHFVYLQQRLQALSCS